MKQFAYNTRYQQGQAEFSRRFKSYLKQHRNWDVEFQWGEEGQKDQTYVAVETYTDLATTLIILNLDRGDIELFGTAFQDKAYQTVLLEQKERELVKEVQQKQR